MAKQRILDTGNTILVDRPSNHVPSTTFDLSHDHKFSFEIGQLVPACVMECMPGDVFHMSTECLLRMQALISPVLHRLNLRFEWFYVPNRILWANWENFISPPQEGFTPPVYPYINAGDFNTADMSLADFMGIPTGYTSGSPTLPNPKMAAMPFAAYQAVITNWYTDEDLTPGFAGDNVSILIDGVNPASTALMTLATRNRDRDYFTSAKPWAQKGSSVIIPALNSPLSFGVNSVPSAEFKWVQRSSAGTFTAGSSAGINTNLTGLDAEAQATMTDPSTSEVGPIGIDVASFGTITAAQFAAVAGTIDQLRQAEALQKFLEADARGGTRYVENLLVHFGVYASDKSLQRAEYLGSSMEPIVISEVLNTTGTSTAPQGQMAGHGIAAHVMRGGIHYMAEEHGHIICIASVLPVSGYYQGVDKMFLRQNRLDFPFPEFASLGEQVLQNQELYYANAGSDSGTFGYVPMYAEWRLKNNRVSGTFRDTLAFWHLASTYSALPTLTGAFISADATVNAYNRIFATLDITGHLLGHAFFDVSVSRKLPRYVRPSI